MSPPRPRAGREGPSGDTKISLQNHPRCRFLAKGSLYGLFLLCTVLTTSGSSALWEGEEADSERAAAILKIELKTDTTVSEQFQASLHLRPLASAGSAGPAVRPVEFPGVLLLPVAIGVPLEARVEAVGWWFSRRLFVPGKEEGPLILKAHPAGYLSGTVTVGKNERLPTVLEIRFDAATSGATEALFPGDLISCPVADGRFECSLPAGALDLRLRARGFVSHYLWHRIVLRGRNLDLGVLTFRRGTSVVGRVEAGADGSPVEGASVVLEPDRLGSPSSRAAGERMKRLALAGISGKGGFFHLVGVQEGQYRLRARKEGLGEALAGSVPVMEDAETRLAAPLRLFPPASVEVRLEPGKDPSGLAWKLSLESFQQRARTQKFLVPVDGEENLWRTTKVPQGEYWLLVKDSEGSTWASQEVKVAGESLRLELTVDFVPVRGQVTLEGEALQARLIFGGRHGLRQLRATADEDGAYEALLPESGVWRVDIEARDPEVLQQLEDVDVGEPDEDGWVDLDFALDDRRIEGELQDSTGRGVQGSVILSYRAHSPVQAMTDDHGHFVYRGLAADTYYLQGIGPRGATTTEPETLELRAEDRRLSTVLRLRGIQKLEGRVMSRWGPVPGARIGANAMRADGTLTTYLSPEAQTEPDGSFFLDLPVNAVTVDLRILAPGYGAAVRQVELPISGPLDIQVYPEAGSLILEGARTGSLMNLEKEFFLYQNGLGLSLSTLHGWRALYQPAALAEGLVLPMMEFGDYKLCRRGSFNPPCSAAFLPPGGEVTLELPAAALAVTAPMPP